MLGRFAEAEADARVAVERAESLYGVEHAWTAIALEDLGLALLGQGKITEAIRTLTKTLAIRERLDPSQERIAETRFALGRALWEAGDERPRALALAHIASEGYRGLHGHQRDITAIDAWLAKRQPGGR